MFIVKEFFPNYFVDTDGNIYHRFKNGKIKTVKGWVNKWGYLQVTLPKRENRSIHKVVAESFLLNPENKTEVNHENGIKTDNRITNLSWVTHAENMQHAYRTGLRAPPSEIPVVQLDPEGTVLQQFRSMSEAERETGIRNGNISNVCKGRQKSAGGFKWTYTNKIYKELKHGK